MKNLAMAEPSAGWDDMAPKVAKQPEAVYTAQPTRWVDTRFESNYALWCYLQEQAPVTFTAELLNELQGLQGLVARLADTQQLRYQILASHHPKVFNLGGDVAFLIRCIRECDSDALRIYAHRCIDLVYDLAVHYNKPITTIALVQGQALGGGFEAALACDVIIAEEDATFSLPEILFNLFPGMGAYLFLSRRLPPRQAERIINGGRTYGAGELFEMGVVDVLAPPGEGELAVWKYMRRNTRNAHGRMGVRRAIEVVDSLRKSDLVSMVEVWVRTAMELSDFDLRAMEHVARAQTQHRRERLHGPQPTYWRNR